MWNSHGSCFLTLDFLSQGVSYFAEFPGVKACFLWNFQPWELTTAVGNAITNAVLCGIYDIKKIVVTSFSLFAVFIFTA